MLASFHSKYSLCPDQTWIARTPPYEKLAYYSLEPVSVSKWQLQQRNAFYFERETQYILNVALLNQTNITLTLLYPIGYILCENALSLFIYFINYLFFDSISRRIYHFANPIFSGDLIYYEKKRNFLENILAQEAGRMKKLC